MIYWRPFLFLNDNDVKFCCVLLYFLIPKTYVNQTNVNWYFFSLHVLKRKLHVKPEKIVCRYILTFDLDHTLITHGNHKAHVVAAVRPRPRAIITNKTYGVSTKVNFDELIILERFFYDISAVFAEYIVV